MSDEVTQSIQDDSTFDSRQSLFGKFRLIRRLGQGAFGVVYLARDTELDREIALKIPKAEGLATPERRERFIREARAAAKVENANICSVYEIGEVDGHCFIAMQLISGRTLAQVLREKKKISPIGAAKLVRKLAQALSEAHREGVVHRDLKPANIMVDSKGQPVIMDFGLARLTSGTDPLTVQGQIIGTPAYMSPEQARGDSVEVEAASDVFSLGVILYEMLCGQRPYKGTINEIIGQLRDESFSAPSPALMRPELDDALVELCQRSLAHQPSKRIGSMKEFAALLTSYLKDKSVSASSDTRETESAGQLATLVEGLATETRLQKQLMKRWTIAVMAAAAMLLALGIFIALQPPATRSVVLSPLNAELRNVIEQDDIRVLIGGKEVAKDYLINGDPLELEVGTEYLVQIYRGDRLIRQETFQVTADSDSISLELPRVADGTPEFLVAQWLLETGASATIRLSDGTEVPLKSTEAVSGRDFEYVSIDLAECAKLTNGQLANLTEITELEELDLSGNLQIEDSGLAHLDHLTTLVSLNLNKTNCADLSLVHLRQNAQLASLSLAESQLSDRGISAAASFRELQSVDLSRTRVSAEGIRSLPTSVTTLNLSGVEIGGSGWEAVADLSILRSLTAAASGIRDEDCARLGSLVRLRHLDLSENAVSDGALAFIANLRELESLSLRGTNVSAPKLESLIRNKTLKKLDLSQTAVSASSLRQLSAFPELTELQLADTAASPLAMRAALAAMPRLETLNLQNTNVDAGSLLQCVSSELKSIDATGTFMNISDVEVLMNRWPNADITHDPALVRKPVFSVVQWALLKGGRVLIRLDGKTQLLQQASLLPDDAQVVELNLANCEVDDASCELLALLDTLEKVSFADTAVTGDVLAYLEASSSTLRAVDLRRTRVSDQQLEYLDRLKQLETLNVSFTDVTGVGVASLGKSQLQDLHLGGKASVDPNVEAVMSLPSIRSLTLHNATLDTFSREAVAAMQQLQRLKLPDATDAEQPRIALLSSLEDYDLSGSSITDASLVHLASMAGLKTLSLANTSVQTGPFDGLKRLNALRELDLSGLALQDSALSSIANLPQLASLNLADTICDNRHFSMLSNMSQLKSIDIRGARVTSNVARGLKSTRPDLAVMFSETQIFEELERIPNLRQREVRRRQLTHIRAANWFLENGANVVILQENGNRLPLTPKHRLPAGPVQVIGVSTPGTAALNVVDDKAMRLLQGIDTLESLKIVSENITDTGIASLQGMDKLQKFDIAKSPLSDRATSYLAAATGLRHFRVADSKMTGATIRLLSKLADLEYLGVPVSEDDELQRRSFDLALGEFKPRSKLSILELSFVPRASIMKLTDLSRIEVFGLTNAVDLNRESISRLKRLRAVKQLVIRDTRIQQGRNRTDFSSLALLDHILRLDLDRTNVTDVDFRSIARLSSLQELSLRNTLVSDEAIPSLSNLKNLRVLHVRGSQIKDLQTLSKLLPRCAIDPE